MMNLELLQTKEHRDLFKLCCLCITSASPSYPGVIVGSIDTSAKQDRFTHVAFSVQSNLCGVPGSVTLWYGANLASFSLPSASFGRTALS